MSEEQKVETNDGTWSSLKKTIVGAISTAVLAGGTWINVNLENNNTNQQKQSGGTNTIIKERVVEKAAPAKEEKPAKKSETEEAPW